MVGPKPFRHHREGNSPADGSSASAGPAGCGGETHGTTPGTVSPHAQLARGAAGRDASTAKQGTVEVGRWRARQALSRLSLATGPVLLARNAARACSFAARTELVRLAEQLTEYPPRIPIRDLTTLRRQFPGLNAEQVADQLVMVASRGSAAVGASVGAIAALPVPPALAVELTTETFAVAAVEIKLIAELHEVYGLRPPGTATQRANAYVIAWAQRRGANVWKQGEVSAVLSGPLKKELRQRLLRKTARSLPTVSPFLVGAAVGSAINGRDTRQLAERIRADLRSHAISWDRLDAAAASPARPKRLPEAGAD